MAAQAKVSQVSAHELLLLLEELRDQVEELQRKLRELEERVETLEWDVGGISDLVGYEG